MTGAEAAEHLRTLAATVERLPCVTVRVHIDVALEAGTTEEQSAPEVARSPAAIRAKLWRENKRRERSGERETNAANGSANVRERSDERGPNGAAAADSGSGSVEIPQEDPEATEAAAARARASDGSANVREHSSERETNAFANAPNGSRERPATGGRVVCPRDLTLTESQRGSLTVNLGIPEWAVDHLLAEFVARYGDGEPRTLDRWRRSAVTAISGRWNNPQTRPKPPGTTDGRLSVGDALARASRLREQELAEAAGAEGSL